MEKLNEVSKGTVLNGKPIREKREAMQRRMELERALTRKQPCRDSGMHGQAALRTVRKAHRAEKIYLLGCVVCFVAAALLIFSML